MLAYLSGRPGAVEDYPFGDDVAVFKVGGRVFAPLRPHRPAGQHQPEVRPHPGRGAP